MRRSTQPPYRLEPRPEAGSGLPDGYPRLPPATQFSHFDVVELGNGVSLDFHTDPDNLKRQHYAFLVSEAEFDGVFQRIRTGP